MPVKTFVSVNDSRWDEYKIDFAHLVNVAIETAMAQDKTENVIKKSNRVLFPWMSVVGMGRAFGDITREISIVLTNDAEIRKLNKKYRKMDKPTNVLSFETGDPELLGDIFISYDTVMKEVVGANDYLPLQKDKFTAHAAHMVVHGVLHLLGYDHLKDKDAEIMEGMEMKIMKKLGFENPHEEARTENRKPKTEKAKWLSAVGFRFSLLFAGALASLGFAPYYIGIATVLGFAALYIFSNDREGFWRGYAAGFWFGVGYGTSMFYWMLNSIFVDPVIAEQMRVWFIPGLLGIALASGVIFGLPVALTSWTRMRGVRRVVAFAALWTFVLWLREWLLTGFPWNPLANIAMPYPWLSNSMSLWGALGLTFVLLGLIFGVANAFLEYRAGARDHRNYLYPFYIFVPLLIAGLVAGRHNIEIAGHRPSLKNPVIIRLVQPSLTQSAKMNMQEANDNVATLLRLSQTETETGAAPDIVVWPETAYPFIISGDEFPPAKELGRMQTLISGAVSDKDGKLFNSMVTAAGASGIIGNLYSKSHLVPFGEYRPFGDIIPTPGQLAAGRGPEIIDSGVVNTHEEKVTVTDDDGEIISETVTNYEKNTFIFAPAICYEIIFTDSLIPRDAGAAPQAIVNITNDNWFGKSIGPFQHLDMARRYAIESGLPIARVGYSGISAFVGSDGRVISQLDLGTAGILDGTLSGAHMTPYRTLGRDWTIAIILAFAAIVVLVPTRGRNRRGK
ncbi:MAG: apolipoprotein N-acyltransferase [Proteobacteria bacterium]|nr:apolipoprotein N-acyltransferase [Pseudomonadota bacterium]